MLISDKAYLKSRKIMRDKVRKYVMIKESLIQEDNCLNMYASNKKASKYMRQKLLEIKGEIDKSTIIVEDFNTPFSVIDASSRQKISKYIVDLNSAINQIDLIDIYKILNSTAKYTFFLRNLDIHCDILLMGYKTQFIKFKKRKSYKITVCAQTTMELYKKSMTERQVEKSL